MKKKYISFLLTIVLAIVIFPTIASAKTKQIQCDYSYNEVDGFDIQKVKFSYTVYDTGSEFKFTSCPGSIKNDYCYTDSGGVFNTSLNGKKFHELSYNKTTQKYDCPSLAYGKVNESSFSIKAREGASVGDYQLLSQRKVFNTGSTYAKQPLCSYKDVIKGVSTNQEPISVTLYYEAAGMYSMSVTYNGKTYNTSPSNGDLSVNFDPGNSRNLNISYSTIKNLFSDFTPGKAYSNNECNNEKKLYFNHYDTHYALEQKRGVTGEQIEGDPNQNPGEEGGGENQPVVEANCETLLGPTLTSYLKTALGFIQIAGVVLAIILGMTDFMGALLSGENDSNKKAWKKFMVRIAMAAVLFLVPALLKFILNTFGLSEYGNSFCIL